MNVEVTKDEVKILESSDLPNENEYKITTCYFTFDEFTSSFQVKRAIFTILSTGEMYETDIINDECDIPVEVLKKEYERIKLGVYGYNIGENEELLNRFSPSYDEFIVPTGSYEEGALSPESITPSQYDLYSQALQQGLSEVESALAEVENVDIDAEQTEDGASVTITNRNGEPKTVTIHDGVSVENMEITNNHLFATYSDSEESVDLGQVVPIKGQDYFTTSEINNIENTVKNQVKSDLDFDNTINRVEQEISNINTNKASKTELEQEKSARELSDTNLQSQIDAITSSSDVVDIVATYSELQNYDTSTLTEEDVIKVLNDSTHNNAISYYRWSNSIWNYVGSEGPFYTRSETDSLLNTKQSKVTDSNKLSSDLVDDSNSGNKFVTTSEKSTWNSKQSLLVSGTNIKTINNQSILGSGNITIEGGGSGTVDTAMSDSSTNAVQNRVIKSYVDDTIDANSIDVQVNNTSIISNNVANILTEGVYGVRNKLLTKGYADARYVLEETIDDNVGYMYISPSIKDDKDVDFSINAQSNLDSEAYADMNFGVEYDENEDKGHGYFRLRLYDAGSIEIDNTGTKITKVITPTNDGDAVNKLYVDSLVGDIGTILDNINGEVIGG